MSRQMQPDAPVCKKCDRYRWAVSVRTTEPDHWCVISDKEVVSQITGEKKQDTTISRCVVTRGTDRCKYIEPKQLKPPTKPKQSKQGFWGMVNRLVNHG